ncbi:MAG: RNA polymerase sigma factor SigJ, partial [Actinomycetota bacterium]|nr:RNA polymerase sigma factor SigJ [Actinomycetota bacterium]
MATLDRLRPDQRAILELLLRQGQSYEAIAGLLGMDASRVRELAAAALVELARATARRLDPE